jgi:hypothetical protein
MEEGEETEEVPFDKLRDQSRSESSTWRRSGNPTALEGHVMPALQYDFARDPDSYRGSGLRRTQSKIRNFKLRAVAEAG